MSINIQDYTKAANDYYKAIYEYQEVKIAYDAQLVEYGLLAAYEDHLRVAENIYTYFKQKNNIKW